MGEFVRSMMMFGRDTLRFSAEAEQTMGMPAVERYWTPADVRELMDETRPWPRYEVIDGELLVTPAPGNRHQLVVGELLWMVATYLEGERVGVACLSPADLELRPGSITQPDVFVLPTGVPAPAEETDGWENVRSLLLAIEVISPSSVRTDRVTKRDHYLDVGVPEYWIVDFEARAFERWSAAQQRPQVARDRLEWRPAGATKPLVIDVPRFFERIAELARLAGLTA
jgi:Uma2 family endonuclease